MCHTHTLLTHTPSVNAHPGVVYIVDCCFVKQRACNPVTGLESLLIHTLPLIHTPSVNAQPGVVYVVDSCFVKQRVYNPVTGLESLLIHILPLIHKPLLDTHTGVVYVVDCCFVKQRAYNPVTGLESLLVAPLAKASAVQRAGRAGRVRAGHCFRLCTQQDYEEKLPQVGVSL